MARPQDLTKLTSDDEVLVSSDRKGCTRLNCPCGQVSPEPRGTGFEGGKMGEEAGGVYLWQPHTPLLFRLPSWTPYGTILSSVSPRHSVPSFSKSSSQLVVSHNNLDFLDFQPRDISEHAVI